MADIGSAQRCAEEAPSNKKSTQRENAGVETEGSAVLESKHVGTCGFPPGEVIIAEVSQWCAGIAVHSETAA